jgi:hypothetical protein
MNIKQQADSYVEMFKNNTWLSIRAATNCAIIHVEGLMKVHESYNDSWTLARLTLDEILTELKSRA